MKIQEGSMCLYEDDSLVNLTDGLKEIILKDFGSISNFCKINDFDKSDLTKFLTRKKDWQVNKLIKLFIALRGRMILNFFDNELLRPECQRNK